MDHRSGHHDELSVIALSDLAVGVPEQDGGGLLGRVVKLLTEPDASGSYTIPVTSYTASPQGSLQHVLALKWTILCKLG